MLVVATIGEADPTIEGGLDGLPTGACGRFFEKAYWAQAYGMEAARLDELRREVCA